VSGDVVAAAHDQVLETEAPREASQRRQAPAWLRPAAFWTMIGLCAFAPLAIGTVHPWSRLVVFSVAGILLALVLVERIATGKRLPITVPLVALGIAVAATALQLIPLPSRLLARLSPAAHELFSTTLGADYGRHALTLDPAGTWSELAKLGAYAAFFFAAVILTSRTNRRRQLIIAIVIIASTIALIGCIQAVVGDSRLLFIYTPEAAGVNEVLVRGSFVNGNHFGALMTLGAPLALALGLREPRLRGPAFAATILLNVGAVLSLSRSAMITAPLAQAITFALDRWQLRQGSKRSSRDNRWLRFAMMGTVVAAIGFGAYLASSRLDNIVEVTQQTELEDPFGNPRSKFYAWSSAFGLALEYPWTGVGRGAFEQAFSRVYDRGGYARFPWVENGYLQALVDWGAPVALLLLVLAGWVLWTALKRMKQDPLATGAMGALLALAVHEVADFSIELPGIAIPALAIAATLFARRSSQSEVARRLVRPWVGYLLAPAAVVAVAVVAFRSPSASAEGTALRAALRDPARSTSSLLPVARAARAAHPADFYIQAFMAARLAREHHPEAMHWLNDAMFLNPSHPSPHLIVAELLTDAGHEDQALLEFRAAAALSPEPLRVWILAAARFPDFDDLVRTVPDTDDGLLHFAHWLRSQKRQADAIRIYERLARRRPQDVAVLTELVDDAIAHKDLARVKFFLPSLVAVDSSLDSERYQVEAAILGGELDAAGQRLDAMADHSPKGLQAEILLALAYSAAGSRDRAFARLDVLTWARSRSDQIMLHEARAEIERRAGNEHTYQWELGEAARLRGNR
jgi:hypothetical protein